jgi:hypothetical protein
MKKTLPDLATPCGLFAVFEAVQVLMIEKGWKGFNYSQLMWYQVAHVYNCGKARGNSSQFDKTWLVWILQNWRVHVGSSALSHQWTCSWCLLNFEKPQSLRISTSQWVLRGWLEVIIHLGGGRVHQFHNGIWWMMLSSGPFCVELPSQGDPPWDVCREGEPLASEHCAKHLGRVTKEWSCDGCWKLKTPRYPKTPIRNVKTLRSETCVMFCSTIWEKQKGVDALEDARSGWNHIQDATDRFCFVARCAAW